MYTHCVADEAGKLQKLCHQSSIQFLPSQIT